MIRNLTIVALCMVAAFVWAGLAILFLAVTR